MSALANTRINQKIINEQADNRIEGDMVDISTTPISVIARIDYIQRFSKQMTVVIDNNPAAYSKVARQYLANISQESTNQEANVAFVAASSKINDIQMRCRLVEQLFANTLFDPEQSLAVSVLRLAKNNNGAITVIVEHAQALSLQIKYELCQLVDTAKKTQNNINVVIFGLEQAAIEIGQNRTIFEKKTSIVDASSGQVIALDHARFKTTTAVFTHDIRLKVGLISLFSLLIIAASWYLLNEYESISFAELPEKPPVVERPVTVVKKVDIIAAENKLASVADIHLALTARESSPKSPVKKAKSDDILQALMLNETVSDNNLSISNVDQPKIESTAIHNNDKQIVSENLHSEKLKDSTPVSKKFDEQYYANSKDGYVIQITGFSDLIRLQTFLNDNQALGYYVYEKDLNTKKFYVVTSKVFNDKAQARAAMNQLPQSLRNLGSFLKPVSIIKREINTVNQ